MTEFTVVLDNIATHASIRELTSRRNIRREDAHRARLLLEQAVDLQAPALAEGPHASCPATCQDLAALTSLPPTFVSRVLRGSRVVGTHADGHAVALHADALLSHRHVRRARGRSTRAATAAAGLAVLAFPDEPTDQIADFLGAMGFPICPSTVRNYIAPLGIPTHERRRALMRPDEIRQLEAGVRRAMLPFGHGVCTLEMLDLGGRSAHEA